MTMIDTTDSRFAKAIALADQAGQWLKCRDRSGHKAYGIRSSRDANHVYFVTQTSCTCEDMRRHPGRACKHVQAVAIHCARAAGKPMPASDVLDGLADLAAAKNPTLTMVRHPDGEISWVRDRELSDRYSDIFERFEGE